MVKEQSSSEVVEAARVAREERQRLRAAQAPALLIEKWWRGRRMAMVTRAAMREGVERKVADIDKVRGFLKQKEFVVPGAMALEVARSASFGRVGEPLRSRTATSIVKGQKCDDPETAAAYGRFFQLEKCLWKSKVLSETAVGMARASPYFAQSAYWRIHVPNSVRKAYPSETWSDVPTEAPPTNAVLDAVVSALVETAALSVEDALSSTFLLSASRSIACQTYLARAAPKSRRVSNLASPRSALMCANLAGGIASKGDVALAASFCRFVSEDVDPVLLSALLKYEDAVLCWDNGGGGESKKKERRPIVVPRWVRDLARSMLDPSFLRFAVDALIPVAPVEPEVEREPDESPSGDDEAEACAKSRRSVFADVLGSKWAKKLDATLASIGGDKKKTTSQQKTSSQQPQQQKRRCDPRLARFAYSVVTSISDETTKVRALNALAFHDKLPCRVLYESCAWSLSDASTIALAMLLKHALIVVDDEDFRSMNRPLSLAELRFTVKKISPLVVQKAAQKKNTDDDPGLKWCAGLLRDLHVRNSRRPWAPAEVWLVDEADDRKALSEMQDSSLLKLAPQTVPFRERAKIVLDATSANPHRRRSVFDFNEADEPKTSIRIRRGRELEDGLVAVSALTKKQLRGRLQITFIDPFTNRAEAGIDAGGLFKEFWTELAKSAFGLDAGLFKAASDGSLYPNPDSDIMHGHRHLDLFHFLGRVVGKAVTEGVTIQPRFNRAFLAFLQRGGHFDFMTTLEDLALLDPDLHKNLKFLTLYDGEVEDLGLTFAVSFERLGQTLVRELEFNGDSKPVTSSNRLLYAQKVAKFHVVDRLQPQSVAFVRGFDDALDADQIRIFSVPELQLLISGARVAVDVDALESSTRYENFSSLNPADKALRVRFWKVAKSLPPSDKANLLKFVTSCERAPPLGFASLQPPFTIRKVPLEDNHQSSSSRSQGSFFSSFGADSSSSAKKRKDAHLRLPSASTCFNLLKLPAYTSEATLKAKLLAAIRSNAGFDLS